MRNISRQIVRTIAQIPARGRYYATGIIIFSITVIGFYSGLFLTKNQAYADSSKVVSVYFDGQKKIISTDASTVGDVLKRISVTVSSEDLVEPTADTKLPQGFYNINVYRARPVVVEDGAKLLQLRSAFQSPRLLAAAAGDAVYPEDSFDSQMVTNFVGDGTVGEKITVHRAKPITIQVDGRTIKARTQTTSVADAIAEQSLHLGQKDTILPALSTQLTPGTTVTIIRVEDIEVTQQEVIPRSVQNISDPTQPLGFTKVKTEGSDGHRTVTYRIHYRDGVEVARETLKIEGDQKPVTKVIMVGTKVIFAGSVEYWRPKVELEAAKYGVDPNRMLRIMACESGGDASNYNGRRQGLSPQQAINQDRAIGLFQFKPTTWDMSGGGDIWDGNRQVEVAAWKMGNYGFSAWQCK